jgi:hypothetical protein
MAGTLAGAATRLPANCNVRWALGANLWNYHPRVPFTDNAPAHEAARWAGILSSAKTAMTFPKTFGADRLVVFSPSRQANPTEAAYKTICECYNQLGEVAGEMGFRAGLHNHLGQMVQDAVEVDRSRTPARWGRTGRTTFSTSETARSTSRPATAWSGRSHARAGSAWIRTRRAKAPAPVTSAAGPTW